MSRQTGAQHLAMFEAMDPAALALVLDLLDHQRRHVSRHALTRSLMASVIAIGDAVLNGTDPAEAIERHDEIQPLVFGDGTPAAGEQLIKLGAAYLTAEVEEALAAEAGE